MTVDEWYILYELAGTWQGWAIALSSTLFFIAIIVLTVFGLCSIILQGFPSLRKLLLDVDSYQTKDGPHEEEQNPLIKGSMLTIEDYDVCQHAKGDTIQEDS